MGKWDPEIRRPGARIVVNFRRTGTGRRPRDGLVLGNVHELWQFTMNEYRKAGWPDHHMLLDHGVGPCWHQQEPILRRKSEHVLEEGIVLALEPHVNFWHLQDMILVTQGAPVLLSAKFNTDEPFVVG